MTNTIATNESTALTSAPSAVDTGELARLFAQLEYVRGCHTVVYDGESETVRVNVSCPEPTTAQVCSVRENLTTYGFAIASLPPELSAAAVVSVCNKLGCTKVFVPDYLKTMPGMVEACGMNFIPPDPNPALPPVSKHKAFLGSQEHLFHVDGANCPASAWSRRRFSTALLPLLMEAKAPSLTLLRQSERSQKRTST